MERPILFGAEMVRAILDGKKTQTRRVVKPQHIPIIETIIDNWENRLSPYGEVGDRLWVRETWKASILYDKSPPRDIPHTELIIYLAGGNRLADVKGKLRPSIFMPRWGSRITLEITNIRVERLQDITETDALSEGVPPSEIGITNKTCYRILWESINGPGSWNDNPYVWVIEFKRANTTCDTCPGISTIACQVCK